MLQPGSSEVYGYTGASFIPIGDVDVTYTSETELILSFDLEDLDLVLDRLSMGLSAGWCGPDNGYFCDQYPDGWGWPYVSFDSGDWYDLSW